MPCADQPIVLAARRFTEADRAVELASLSGDRRRFVAAARERRLAAAELLPLLSQHGEPVAAGLHELSIDPATGLIAARIRRDLGPPLGSLPWCGPGF